MLNIERWGSYEELTTVVLGRNNENTAVTSNHIESESLNKSAPGSAARLGDSSMQP